MSNADMFAAEGGMVSAEPKHVVATGVAARGPKIAKDTNPKGPGGKSSHPHPKPRPTISAAGELTHANVIVRRRQK